MAENESLDLGHARSGRWRKWAESFRQRRSTPVLAKEGLRSLTKTISNVQKLMENENKVPIKELLVAAEGEDGSMEEVVKRSRCARDYAQLIASQADQGLDRRTIAENMLSLTTDRFLSQIGHDLIDNGFEDAKSFREFALSVKEEMLGGIASMASRIVEEPDLPLRMPRQTSSEKDKQQADLLAMSIGLDGGGRDV